MSSSCCVLVCFNKINYPLPGLILSFIPVANMEWTVTVLPEQEIVSCIQILSSWQRTDVTSLHQPSGRNGVKHLSHCSNFHLANGLLALYAN